MKFKTVSSPAAAESIIIIISLIDVNLTSLHHADELFKENQRRWSKTGSKQDQDSQLIKSFKTETKTKTFLLRTRQDQDDRFSKSVKTKTETKTLKFASGIRPRVLLKNLVTTPTAEMR